ncbi:type I-E CRISPR-associated endonuclease Cas1 [Corynebacterium sp. 3HC-13]|uniref:type I-E CRISPR-associated endonuclease Cas1e n=1 Tax=Corynebacterium poyangense TaxID=2684405 RepID=UPI001CCE428E|nr:type I-E CRISPR-associated endonuclease Cas1e [Corynebacterium poyangense]MBZ8178366.1 type I-E CRISPR-associated endonuclease Cas1 [Corynebacterium poyangense]
MAYSEEALAFSTISPSEQIRLEDRVSYLYVEYCLIRQDRTGVIAISRGDERAPEPVNELPAKTRIQLPVGGLATLILGPGTSISQPAATSCARSGVSVLFSGSGGIQSYCLATPLTSSARWAIAQARLVANEARQRDAARILYRKQLGIDDVPMSSIAAMRGIEGRMMRDLYKKLATKHHIKGFRRDTNSPDYVNSNLNLANSILYGCAASVCSVLGINPALGIIHRGNSRSLLFDLADLYKREITIPLAFRMDKEHGGASELRKELRRCIQRRKILEEMMKIMMSILEPHLPKRDDDRLIGGMNHEVPGHTQYGSG